MGKSELKRTSALLEEFDALLRMQKRGLAGFRTWFDQGSRRYCGIAGNSERTPTPATLRLSRSLLLPSTERMRTLASPLATDAGGR